MNAGNGKLWVVCTPIGNLEDLTLRAIRILKTCDVVLAEDTRRASILLKHLEISGKELISVNEHNQTSRLPLIMSRLNNGKEIALVTDAGMPVISDPGYTVVESCQEKGIEIDIAPGPSAVTTAVALSGFPGSHFTFFGFLPRGKQRRRIFRKIAEGSYENSVIVFFESPYRLKKSLNDYLEIIGNRDCFIGREMTKMHQELLRGKIGDIIETIGDKEVKGEITVVISGRE